MGSHAYSRVLPHGPHLDAAAVEGHFTEELAAQIRPSYPHAVIGALDEDDFGNLAARVDLG
jgi:hypothetical protein